MIPNIFISSTIEDLHHLRDAIRDTIEELGYNPIMSEYGDIGYLPTTTAEDSCYRALRDCQLSILLIGKRYGSVSLNDLSITYNEFKTAQSKKVPIITLVDRDVLTYKHVYDANINKSTKPSFPGMDKAEKIFSFIQEISGSPQNNAIMPYGNVANAKENLRKQIAHLFGELLRNRFDPFKSEIKDVLAEVTALKHNLIKDKTNFKFVKAVRFLLDDKHKIYKELVESIYNSLDEAIVILLQCQNFDDLVKRAGGKIKIRKNEITGAEKNKLFEQRGIIRWHQWVVRDKDIISLADVDERNVGSLYQWENKNTLISPLAKEFFDAEHADLMKTFSGQ